MHKARFLPFLALVCLLPLLAGCGADTPTQTPVAPTVTPAPIPPSPTAIPPTIALSFDDAHATAQAAANATQIVVERPTLTAQAASVATEAALPKTETPVPPTKAPPTPVPASATPAPLPSFGDTIETLGWRMSLAKMTHAQTVDENSSYYFEASGTYWLVYLDARNQENSTRTLANTVTWFLVDDHGANYGEASHYQEFTVGSVASYMGRSALNLGITPRGLTHPLLIFDVAADAVPVRLYVQGPDTYDPDAGAVQFNLGKK